MRRDELLSNAMSLPVEARLDLVMDLLNSLDDRVASSEADALERVEARLAEIDAGAETVPHAEAMQRLRSRLVAR